MIGKLKKKKEIKSPNCENLSKNNKHHTFNITHQNTTSTYKMQQPYKYKKNQTFWKHLILI